MGHKPFLLIADYLARQGIATLRYDDRATAGSVGGDMKNAKVSFIDGIGKNGDELISLLDIRSIIEEKENA